MQSAVPPYELVIVSYRSRPHIVELLAGLPDDLPVVIVDNSSGADGVQDVVTSRPNGRYIDGGGVGFAKAANQGARSSAYEYVIFVNPDCRPTSRDLDLLVQTLDLNPEYASCAATMTDGEGNPEIGNGGWEPSVRRALVHGTGLHKVLPNEGLFATPRPYLPVDVDWTTGACMAVRTSLFQSLGGFDENYYVYNEDVAFGRAVREKGMRQSLRTDILVPHGAGGSGAPSMEMLRLRGASMAKYVNQHQPEVPSVIIRSCLAAGYMLRVGQQLAKRNPQRAREHLSYVKGVMTGRASVGGKDVTSV